MRTEISQLNKVFDNRMRIGIMSTLMVQEEINFNDLKAIVEATDGNLASHLKTLEDHKYIKVKKGFIGRKTNTIYAVTATGEQAFRKHLAALAKIIKSLG